jgi:hypothetical protein
MSHGQAGEEFTPMARRFFAMIQHESAKISQKLKNI